MWNELWRSVTKAVVSAATIAEHTPPRGLSAIRSIRDTVRDDVLRSVRSLISARLYAPVSDAFSKRKQAVLDRFGAEEMFEALERRLFSKRRRAAKLDPTVRKQAQAIAEILSRRGRRPNRIGIDGLPGSGKSTLAHAVALELNMKWKSLDFRKLGEPGLFDLKRTVYEHNRLLRVQDVEMFDAILYINEPAERSVAKVARRGRGVLLAVLLDYEKMKSVGALAFEVCDGKTIAIPESDILLKIKPKRGFRAMPNIRRRLRARRLRTTGMSQEEMLLLLAYGKREAGLSAYFLPLVHRIRALAGTLYAVGRKLVRSKKSNAASPKANSGVGKKPCGFERPQEAGLPEARSVTIRTRPSISRSRMAGARRQEGRNGRS